MSIFMVDVGRILDFLTQDIDEIDRGWMLLERDVINHAKVIRALEYIRTHATDDVLILTQEESQLMADETGESTGQKIRRHIIIQLETVGFIIRNTTTPDWRIQITTSGKNYLDALNKKRYFQEHVIERLVFCNEEWATSRRAQAYNDFDINSYQVVSRLMPALDNKLYLEEMTYFVSKIKTENDIEPVLELIRIYRSADATEKLSIRTVIKEILDRQNRERYGNWRKHNKRTFEFFSMGTEYIMDYESDDLIDTFPLRRSTDFVVARQTTLIRHVREIEDEYPYEATPEVSRDETDFNSGVEGENIVKNILEEIGFSIRDFTGSNKGFDILALRNDARFFVEVKSSVGQCSPTLTAKEHEMAERYGEVYILAIVEDVFKTPNIYFIINPLEEIGDSIQERTSITYTIPRAEWHRVATEELNNLLPEN